MNGTVTLVVQMYTVHGVIEYKCWQVATPQDTPHNLKQFLNQPGSIMNTERVKSKNLFNFRLQGLLDEDIEAFYEKMKTEHNIHPEAIKEKTKNQTEIEFAEGMRAMIEGGIRQRENSFYTASQVVEVS